jgi:hypothetical protein
VKAELHISHQDWQQEASNTSESSNQASCHANFCAEALWYELKDCTVPQAEEGHTNDEECRCKADGQ